MPYSFPADLQDLVGEQMKSGAYRSEDELLRDALRALAEEQDDLADVRDALADWRAGDAGVPLKESFAIMRSKYNIAEPN